MKVDILPTCGTHLKDPIISLRGVLGQENKFIVSIFQWSAVPTLKSELSFFIFIYIGLSPSIVVNRNWIWVSCLNPSVFLLPKTFKLFGFLIFRLWVYLMKVIQETCCAHRIIYLCLNCYHFVDISADGLYVSEGIIHLLVSISVLTWFLGYIWLKFKFQKLK